MSFDLSYFFFVILPAFGALWLIPQKYHRFVFAAKTRIQKGAQKAILLFFT